MNVKIEPEWGAALHAEFEKPYFGEIVKFLKEERATGKIIYPEGTDIFSAFSLTPFSKVKVVVLGQDPYHGEGQAHGLSFSVKKGIPIPRSLMNMYRELKADLNIDPPEHGYLEQWAQQGVLMLNTFLTVEESKPGSHSKIGWEQFTNAVIKTVSDQLDGIVFLLWGRFAQQKETLIDTSKHFVLKSAHPSPFSATAGFFGSRPYSETNKILKQQGKEIINWKLDS